VLVEEQADLRGEHDVVAERRDRLSHHALGVPAAVHVGRVDQPHTALVGGA
jgi:hypothetical protein